MFAPGYRKGGDIFEIDSYLISVTHAADYNAYKVINFQVSSSENEEVSV